MKYAALWLLLLLTLPALAHAVRPPLPYAMEQWSDAADCDMRHRRPPAESAPIDSIPPDVLMQRFFGVLDAVLAGDETALKFARLCDRFDVELFPGMLPPALAEPWNPSPPPPVGQVFVGLIDEPGQVFHQRIEATYLPDGASLSLSFSSNKDAAPFAYDVEYRYLDMGDACPLRLGQLADKLLAAGFSKEYFALQPPDPERMEPDFGVGAGFQRGNVNVSASLQGRFVDQRAHPDAACVAEIRVGFSK